MLRKTITLLLVVLLVAGTVLPVLAVAPPGPGNPWPYENPPQPYTSQYIYSLFDGDPYAPYGSKDVALGLPVTSLRAVDENGANNYLNNALNPGTGWALGNLTSGVLTDAGGNPHGYHSKIQGKAIITMDLGDLYEISQIVVYPWSSTNAVTTYNYTYTLSFCGAGGKTIDELKDSDFSSPYPGIGAIKNDPAAPDRKPLINGFAGKGIKARFVRITATRVSGTQLRIAEVSVHPKPGDKAALQALFNESARFTQDLYGTNSNWPAFASAVNAAKAALSQKIIFKAELDRIYAGLSEAMAGFLDTRELFTLYNTYKDMLEAFYISGWGGLQTALAGASDVLNSSNANQQMIDHALDALRTAVGNLVLKKYYSVLEAFFSASQGKDKNLYTPESWGHFQSVMDAAKDVLYSIDDEAKAAYEALSTAVRGLARKQPAEISELQRLYDAHKNKRASDYKSWSWPQFAAALSNAGNVLNNLYATPEDVRDAIAALTLAVSRLYAPNAILDLKHYDPFRPEGAVNLSMNKPVSYSNSYENYGWFANNLNDGLIGGSGAANESNGWNSHPWVAPQDNRYWLVIDLKEVFRIDSVALWPRQDNLNWPSTVGLDFPVDYNIEFSTDGEHYWGTVYETGKIKELVKDIPQFTVLNTPVKARYVRINMTRKQTYTYCLSEAVVYGRGVEELSLCDKTSRRLTVGKTWQLPDFLIYPDNGSVDLGEVLWDYGDSRILSVDKNGLVTALAEGQTTVTAYCKRFSLKAEWVFDVRKSTNGLYDRLLVSAFWPPELEPKGPGVNAEQFDLMAEAGIDNIQNVSTNNLLDRDTNMLMARLAAERGMLLNVCDRTFKNFDTLNKALIEQIVDAYADVPGVGGFYMIDEPADLSLYADTIRYFKELAPDLYMHINDSPFMTEARCRKFADAVTNNGADPELLDYIMFDVYPFAGSHALGNRSINYPYMLNLMEVARRVGLDYGVKTAQYLQTAGGFRPGTDGVNEDELRYQIYVSLAYGFKQLSYFTWSTPIQRSEPFTHAVLDVNGNPLPIYEGVKRLNAEIHALSDVVYPLNAVEVYFTGINLYGQKAIPHTFFAQPAAKDDMVYSHMVDKYNGTEYLMVVNNSIKNPVTHTVKLDAGILYLSEVSHKDGSFSRVGLSGNDNSVTLDFRPGEGRIFRINRDSDTLSPQTTALPNNIADDDNADITAVKTLVQNATYTATQADVDDIAKAKAAVETIISGLSLNGVTAAVTDDTFTGATAGTSGEPDGANGSYTFRVKLNKGAGSEQTHNGTLTITATAYDPVQDNLDIGAAKNAAE